MMRGYASIITHFSTRERLGECIEIYSKVAAYYPMQYAKRIRQEQDELQTYFNAVGG